MSDRAFWSLLAVMTIAIVLIFAFAPRETKQDNGHWECSEYRTDGYECECDDAYPLHEGTHVTSDGDLTGRECLNESYIKYLVRNDMWSYCMYSNNSTRTYIEPCPTENIEYWSCTPINECVKEVWTRSVNQYTKETTTDDMKHGITDITNKFIIQPREVRHE